ncbi:hypothetical protein PVAP13_8NG256505 [Panicum virgatum]|uniref:Uncharacterized protein n=1 Tax=Panicum virgatum TaxID=38727 RepID=A0A8T0P5P9_PANVG|nr:hypothetical protein PVAP13_8NG256505 [Panicum virgatum]
MLSLIRCSSACNPRKKGSSVDTLPKIRIFIDGKDSVTTSRKFVKLYDHFHPPCVLHPGSAYTMCSSAVPHFQIEGERERRVSTPVHFIPHFLSRVIRSPLSSLASILRFFTSNLLNHPHTSNSARSGGDQRHL